MYCLRASVCQWSLSEVLFSNFSLNTCSVMSVNLYYHVMVYLTTKCFLVDSVLANMAAEQTLDLSCLVTMEQDMCLGVADWTQASLVYVLRLDWECEFHEIEFWVEDITHMYHMHACQVCELLRTHLIEIPIAITIRAWQSHKVKSWLQSKNPDPSYTRLSIHEFLIENYPHSAVQDDCSDRSEQSWWAGFCCLIMKQILLQKSTQKIEIGLHLPCHLYRVDNSICLTVFLACIYIVNAFVVNLYMYLQDAICKGLTVCTCFSRFSLYYFCSPNVMSFLSLAYRCHHILAQDYSKSFDTKARLHRSRCRLSIPVSCTTHRKQQGITWSLSSWPHARASIILSSDCLLKGCTKW